MKAIVLIVIGIISTTTALGREKDLLCFSCQKEIRDGALVENDQTKSCITFRKASEEERRRDFVEKCFPPHDGCKQTNVKSSDGQNSKQIYGCYYPEEELNLSLVNDVCVNYEEDDGKSGTFCKCEADFCLVPNDKEDNSHEEGSNAAGRKAICKGGYYMLISLVVFAAGNLFL